MGRRRWGAVAALLGLLAGVAAATVAEDESGESRAGRLGTSVAEFGIRLAILRPKIGLTGQKIGAGPVDRLERLEHSGGGARVRVGGWRRGGREKKGGSTAVQVR